MNSKLIAAERAYRANTASEQQHNQDLKLGHLKHSNAAADSVDSDIFCAVIHLQLHS